MTLVSALLFSSTAGILLTKGYDEIKAAEARSSKFKARWVLTGAWCSCGFITCILLSAILYIDLSVFVRDGAKGEDARMKVWIQLNRKFLILCAGSCFVSVLLLLSFLFLTGFAMIDVDQVESVGWYRCGLTGCFIFLWAALTSWYNWKKTYPSYLAATIGGQAEDVNDLVEEHVDNDGGNDGSPHKDDRKVVEEQMDNDVDNDP